MVYKNLKDFINFLQDFNNGLERKYQERKGYWVLYKRCVQIIKSCCGTLKAEAFTKDIKVLFPLVNQIVPYLNYIVFQQYIKQYKRMWLLIYYRDLHSEVEAREILSWKEIREMHKSSWKIGQTKLEVI